ncbi:MAG: hypothetical protein KGI25_00105 [Thaumarchaeota archaeon]|nr:hypothetical protein [Nitrososphaerota archaeon]
MKNLNILLLVLCGGIFFATVPHALAQPTITWDCGSFCSHSLSDGAVGSFFSPTTSQFTVSDPSLASPTLNHIIVLVNSTTDPSGITLNLTETAPNSGMYTNTNLIFTNGTGTFGVSSSQTIGINNPSLITDATKVETLVGDVMVFSTTDTTGISMNLTETGPGTGIFTATLQFTSGPSVNGKSISVQAGDTVTIMDFLNFDVTNELVTPNPDPAFGALPSSYGDEVDAVFDGVKAPMYLNAGSAPGGGGGGLIRPSTVLDLALGGGKSADTFDPPSIGNDYYYRFGGGVTINNKPFTIANYSTTILQQVLDIGKPAKFGFKIFDERGAYTISDVVMYFHFKGDPSPQNADTWISWDRSRGPLTHDPNGIFSATSINTTISGKYLLANFTMVPQKTMPDSSLIMRMWDDKLAMGDVPIWGAIVIVDPNAPVPVKKVPDNQYGDYVTLENILGRDGYDIPLMLNKMHSLADIYTSLEINWVYDKGVDKLTMVESDKSGNLMGELVCNLTKKIVQPKVTDHGYFLFTTKQLNRQDVQGEEAAKLAEADKALKLVQSLGLVRQNNFDILNGTMPRT